MVRWLISFLLVLFHPASTDARHHFIGTKKENRLLAWDDFKGTPDPLSRSLAHTYWRVHYWIDDTAMSGDTVACKFRIHVTFDTARSWVKPGKGTDKLLKHEQGHFDIAKLCGRELKFRFAALQLYKYDYEQQVMRKFEEVFQKYVDIQQLYDDESDHGASAEGQQKWDVVFEREFPRNSTLPGN
jgi:hypothetical protein